MTAYPELLATLSQLSDTTSKARTAALSCFWEGENGEAARKFSELMEDAQLLVEHAKKVAAQGHAKQDDSPRQEATAFDRAWYDLAGRIHRDNVDKGFWPLGVEDRNIGEAIALMHSELSEALEAYREGNLASEKIPGFSGAEEEFADLIIRVMDFTAAHKLRIPEAIAAKVQYNRGRPTKHGKAF